MKRKFMRKVEFLNTVPSYMPGRYDAYDDRWEQAMDEMDNRIREMGWNTVGHDTIRDIRRARVVKVRTIQPKEEYL